MGAEIAVNPGKKTSTMETWAGAVWIGEEPTPLNAFIMEKGVWSNG